MAKQTMKCPECGGKAKSKMWGIAEDGATRLRIYRCEECAFGFSTEELVLPKSEYSGVMRQIIRYRRANPTAAKKYDKYGFVRLKKPGDAVMIECGKKDVHKVRQAAHGHAWRRGFKVTAREKGGVMAVTRLERGGR